MVIRNGDFFDDTTIRFASTMQSVDPDEVNYDDYDDYDVDDEEDDDY